MNAFEEDRRRLGMSKVASYYSPESMAPKEAGSRVPERDKSAVDVEMDRLSLVTGGLAEMVSELSRRLSPVMRVSPIPMPCEAKEDHVECPLAGEIRVMSEGNELTAQRLRNMIDALAI